MVLSLVCASPYTATVKCAMLLYADIQSTQKGEDASTLSTPYATFDLHINNVPFKFNLFYRRYVTQNVIIWNIQTLKNSLYLFS